MSGAEVVVICGGGMMGCSLAFYLSKLNSSAKVLVVESGETVANQASGKAGGFLASNWCSGSLTTLATKSFELHGQLAQEVGVDIGYRQLDTVAIQVDKTLKDKSNKSLSVPNYLDVSKVESSSSLGSKRTTAQVHPELLVKALFTEASKRCDTTLIRGVVKNIHFEKNSNKVKGVMVEKHGSKEMELIEADVVAITMGPWSDLARKWFPKASLPYITGGRAHSIVLECESADAKAVFLGTPDGDPEIYPRPDNTVYVCGESDNQPLPSNPSEVEPDIRSCSQLHEIVASISPQLASSTVLKQQACYLPYCPDGMPIIGALKHYSGAYIATGHGCWGILNGPATGLGLAELIVKGKAESVDLSHFDPARFG